MNTATLPKKDLLFSNRDLKRLIIPLIIEQFLAVLVGLADSIMVASVGEAAVSGVSLVDGIMILLINIFSALATGGAVVAGQYLGREDEDMACKASDQLVRFIALISIIIMIIIYVGKGFILNVVFGKIAEDVYNYANIYLIIVALSIPFIALYNAGAAIFRSMGNSKISMKASIIMNLINVIGNAICIFGLKMGTEGVAIPTLVSRIVGALLILYLLTDKGLKLHIQNHFSFYLNKDLIKKILYIGVPNGLENSMFQLGKIMVLSLVSGFGTYAIAANAVSNSVANFQILPGMAMSLAMTTVISRCIGAQDYEQAKYYTKKLHKISYISITIAVIIIMLMMPLILKAYNLTDQTAYEAKKILLFHGVSSILIWPVAFNLPCVFRAAGDVRYTMIVSILSMWFCRIVLSYVIGLYLGLGVFGVWVAMVIDWVVRTMFFVVRYKNEKWKNFTAV